MNSPLFVSTRIVLLRVKYSLIHNQTNLYLNLPINYKTQTKFYKWISTKNYTNFLIFEWEFDLNILCE